LGLVRLIAYLIEVGKSDGWDRSRAKIRASLDGCIHGILAYSFALAFLFAYRLHYLRADCV
jgi:hypothetical protein